MKPTLTEFMMNAILESIHMDDVPRALAERSFAFFSQKIAEGIESAQTEQEREALRKLRAAIQESL